MSLQTELKKRHLKTKLGGIRVTASPTHITEVTFVDRRGQDSTQPYSHLDEAIDQLEEFFAGDRVDFDLPLDLSGTEFQNKVWKALRRIPYGRTKSYKQVAQSIKNPNAMRAVGLANNKNNLAIVVPCHRVVGHNGDLVGYAGQLWRKRWLLEFESARAS